MKKLLICSDSFLPRWDGIARFLIELIPKLKLDFQIRVIIPRFPGKLVEIPGVKIIRLPISKLTTGDFSVPRFSKSAIKEHISWAEIIWTQTIGPIGGAAIIAGNKAGKPVVSYIHSLEWELFSKSIKVWKGFVYKATKRLAKYLYNKSSLLLVPSLEVVDILQSNGINTPSKPLFLGVDTHHFIPPEHKGLAKSAIGLQENLLTIGYCGRIGREKDLITLYRAYLRVRRRIKHTRLIIVGEGIHDWDKLFDSKEDIINPGSQNNVLPYLQALDVFVLPSLTETTSLATLEAMACGIPPITTKVGLVKEYVNENWNGLFFEMGDAYGLYLKLAELLEDGAKRERLGRNARKTVIEMYDFKKTVEDIKHVLGTF